MVRLVFRPYTQVGRPICTSGPLRASTRVSSGFALPRHSSPSFGSYRARSCSTSPTGRARRAGGAPGAGAAGIPPEAARAALHFHCATGFRASPPTRARVRLLGPCFKTGLVGSRHRRGPLAPVARAGPRPGGATRSGRTEGSPSRSTVAPGAGGPVPAPEGGQGAETRFHGPGGNGEVGARRAVKLGRVSEPSHLRAGPFQADPEPVATHRRGESAPGGGTGQRTGAGSPAEARDPRPRPAGPPPG